MNEPLYIIEGLKKIMCTNGWSKCDTYGRCYGCPLDEENSTTMEELFEIAKDDGYTEIALSKDSQVGKKL